MSGGTPDLLSPACPRPTSGSALVLVLLVIALLTTTVVGFLSTARIEQLAARNFSQQNAAAGLAELATQQAMANIALGFNTTGNLTGNYTSVVTTQPGAIHKYFFQNGTVTQNTTVGLFSSGNLTVNSTSTALAGNSSSQVANLNNLSNPVGNATGNLSLTGNSSEEINVNMEEIRDTEGNLVGRIAYYVDDEGAKLNVNNATGNRTTLNAGSSRSLSFSALSANNSANFTTLIDGSAGNGTSDVNYWKHFFRPEQVGAAVPGLEQEELAKISVASGNASDFHIKKTPWGTERLFINDLPIDSTGVDAIYEALSGKNATTGNASSSASMNATCTYVDPETGDQCTSGEKYKFCHGKHEWTGQKLRDIYGTTFAEKYTDAGLKQIAANILQARHPQVLNHPDKSHSYNGSLLGANSTEDFEAIADCCDAVKKVIPKDYLGHAPFPFINEVGVTVVWQCENVPPNYSARLSIRPFITIMNPYGLSNHTISMPANKIAEWEVEMQIDSIRFDVTHKTPAGVSHTFTYGPRGFANNDSWGHTATESANNLGARNSGRILNQLEEDFIGGWGPWSYKFSGQTKIGSDFYANNAARSPVGSPNSHLDRNQEMQFQCPPHPRTGWSPCIALKIPKNNTQITNISNIRVKFEYIRLLAKAGDDTTIRDWVLADDMEIEGWLQAPLTAPAPGGTVTHTNGWPETMGVTYQIPREQTIPPPKSYKRIDGRLKSTISGLLTRRESMKPWGEPLGESSPNSWPTKNPTWHQFIAGNTADIKSWPYETRNNEIPGDANRWKDSGHWFAYDARWYHLWPNAWPKIEFTNPTDGTGLFTCPADLGKIQTNIQHRKLRMTTQHPNEIRTSIGGKGNATYIPDWAMLDVVSFGTNATGDNYSAPAAVNINGRFHVPSGSPQPSARTDGVKSMLKTLDSGGSATLGNPFNSSNTTSVETGLPGQNSSYHDPLTNLSTTIAGNLGNLTWTVGNFTGGNATWGRGNASDDPGSRRKAAKFPTNQIVLPSEVTEIRNISDNRKLDTDAAENIQNIKGNEGRLSALFPGATTQSRFFTIYAFAQALNNVGQIDSEAVTKTLVEVEEQNPITDPPTYKVKKLYTQPISVP